MADRRSGHGKAAIIKFSLCINTTNAENERTNERRTKFPLCFADFAPKGGSKEDPAKEEEGRKEVLLPTSPLPTHAPAPDPVWDASCGAL